MDGSHFDALTRTLSAPGSRRRAVGGLLVGTLTLLGNGLEETQAHDLLKKCKTLKGDKKKKCVKKAKAHNATHLTEVPPPSPPTVPPPRKPNASCDVPANQSPLTPTTGYRLAQTFTEPNGGKLDGVELYFNNSGSGSGDYLLQINTVDPNTGVPTNNTIASTQLPRSQVGNNPDIVGFTFVVPATLVAGRHYALVLSQPSGSGFYQVWWHHPGTCPGSELFVSSTATGSFSKPDPNSSSDLSFYKTFVSL